MPTSEMVSACAKASTSAASEPALTPYHIQVFDMYTLVNNITIYRPADSISPALDLLDNGYIAKTPAHPQVAVSVKTLELLYRLRQRKASFSIEAFAKVVCDYYTVCTAICYHFTQTTILIDPVPLLSSKSVRGHFRSVHPNQTRHRKSTERCPRMGFI